MSDLKLTVGRDSQGRMLAIISTGGHPQINPEVQTTILTVEIVKNMKEAKAWFKQQSLERPWETRQ